MFTLKPFQHLGIKVAIASLASHVIVVQSASESWHELFDKYYYYTSLLYSMIIAYLIIEFIYLITKRIDKRMSSSQLSAERIMIQFYLGFGFTAFLAIFLAGILFMLHGQNILYTGYFKKFYIHILLFIFTINLIYLLYFHHQRSRTIYRILVNEQKFTDVKNTGKLNQYAIFYHENKMTYAVGFNGEKIVWDNSIEGTLKMLNANLYFQINRSVIIHRRAVAYIERNGFYTTNIILSFHFKRQLTTSRRRDIDFKDWYAMDLP